MSSNCIFCKIITGEAPGKIFYQDNEILVFEDIKPSSIHHYLSIPKQHISDVNYLTSPDHKDLLHQLIEKGKSVLKENGGDVNDTRMGFHCPPFNSIPHLHLHIISPVSEMTFFSRIIFKPNTWWFQSVDQLLEKLNNGTSNSKL